MGEINTQELVDVGYETGARPTTGEVMMITPIFLFGMTILLFITSYGFIICWFFPDKFMNFNERRIIWQENHIPFFPKKYFSILNI